MQRQKTGWNLTLGTIWILEVLSLSLSFIAATSGVAQGSSPIAKIGVPLKQGKSQPAECRESPWNLAGTHSVIIGRTMGLTFGKRQLANRKCLLISNAIGISACSRCSNSRHGYAIVQTRGPIPSLKKEPFACVSLQLSSFYKLPSRVLMRT